MSETDTKTDESAEVKAEPSPKKDPVTEKATEAAPTRDTEKNAKAVSDVSTSFQNSAIQNLNIYSTTRGTQRRPPVGKLDDEDISNLLRNFVTPKSYVEALAALSADHVVVLEGQIGDGRHAAAVSLLQELTDERLNMLTPIIGLKDLADREYDASQGFIVVDRIIERESVDTDFVWRTVRDRVRSRAAYLVITCGAGATSTIESVKHIRWERPDLDQVLRAHLPEFDDARIAELMATIPEAWRMAEVARFCERLNDGQPIEDAEDTFGIAAIERVKAWFGEEPSLREVLAVTTMSFASGASHRDFEAHLGYLDKRYRERSSTAKEKQLVATELPPRRKQLFGEGSLIVEKRTRADLKAKTVVVFRSSDYRLWVLEQLWRDYDSTLWDSVRAWIDDALLDLDEYELAYGLALLAEIDFEEVSNSYLFPWSQGHRGWPGQVASTFVLWLMCGDESMSRIALKTATRWAAEGSPAQRWTAAIAFSGELGRLYPADAVRRLWHLIVQSPDTDPAARFALAGLFSYLVSTDSDASLILRVLLRHVNKFQKTDLRMYELTMTSILAVFSVWDDTIQQPSVFGLIRTQPERLELVVSLWAALLRNHLYRKDAIEAMISGIKSLEKIKSDASTEVREIGEALSDALSPDEQALLLRGIQALYNRSREKASVLEVLLVALTNSLRKLKTKGAQ